MPTHKIYCGDCIDEMQEEEGKKCNGDKYCKRCAEYKILLKNKVINVCGHCFVANYITSKGLKSEVLWVVKL